MQVVGANERLEAASTQPTRAIKACKDYGLAQKYFFAASGALRVLQAIVIAAAVVATSHTLTGN